MSEYFCKDCKHSFRTVSTILLHGFNSQYSRLCRLSYKETKMESDPVIGLKKVPGGYSNCSTFRIRKDDCGPEARLWEPKDKKNLFKYIVKESS